MSTSIAVLPAYQTSKVSRTKARANRTIFGTTLDNSGKAQAVFQNDEGKNITSLSGEYQLLHRYQHWPLAIAMYRLHFSRAKSFTTLYSASEMYSSKYEVDRNSFIYGIHSMFNQVVIEQQ